MPDRRAAQCLLVCAGLLVIAHNAFAQESAVTVLSQERIVEVQVGDRPVHRSSETGTGLFDAEEVDEIRVVSCIPRLGCPIEFIDGHATARQHSFIGTSPDGVVEIAVEGSLSYYAGVIAAVRARTRLVTSFSVAGVVHYSLALFHEGGFAIDPVQGAFSLTLTRSDGVVIRQSIGPTRFSGSSFLGPGTYTLTVEYAGEVASNGAGSGNFKARLTAGREPTLGPECTVSVDKGSYTVGDVVKARLALRNRGPARPIENKVWFRVPPGAVVPALNRGSDGSFSMDLGADVTYDFDLFGIGPELPHGLYEFGCIVLDPHTGAEFDVSSAVFQIQ
jgi:hypothetical protein